MQKEEKYAFILQTYQLQKGSPIYAHVRSICNYLVRLVWLKLITGPSPHLTQILLI